MPLKIDVSVDNVYDSFILWVNAIRNNNKAHFV